MSTQQGGNRERCCADCYNQHSAVVERHPQDEATSSTPGTPFRRLLQAGRALSSVSGYRHTRAPSLPHVEFENINGGDVVVVGTDEGDKVEDGVFDIITEEEVSGVYDSDSFANARSPAYGQQGAAQM